MEKKMKIKQKVVALLFLAIAAFATFAFSPVDTQAAMADNAYTKPFNAPYYEYRTATTLQSATSYQVGWNQSGGKWFYMTDSRHYYADGLATIGGKNYLFDHNGYCVTGWVRFTEDVKWGYQGPRIMYFDPTNAWMVTQYQVIDGIGRSFGNSGYLQYGRGNKVVWNGVEYILDDAGVCAQWKPSQGTSLVDAKTKFETLAEDDVVDGNYEFQAQVNDNTEVVPWGFTPIKTKEDYSYISFNIVSDDSMKGQFGAWYYNVGTYKGRVIDAKSTVTDYDLYDQFGTECAYIGMAHTRLGIAISNCVSAEVKIEFYDHETGKPVDVQGFATVTDIDSAQACEITSDYDKIYVADDCELMYTPGDSGNPIFCDPIENGKLRNDGDTSGQVLVNFTGSSFSFRFYNDDSFWESNGVPFYSMSDTTSTSHPFFTVDDVMNASDLGNHSWQGYIASRPARVATPHPPAKTVSDSDEKDVTTNTLKDMDEGYSYKISENVPMQASNKFYYTNYQIVDKLEPCLDYVSARVENDAGQDVSSLYSINVSGQTVTFTCKDPSADSFYGQTYHYIINVKIDKTSDLSGYLKDDHYEIPNKGSLIVKSDYEDETYDTNQVITKVKVPEPAKITINLTKTGSNTECTEGNPNYTLKDTEVTVYSDEKCTVSVGKITTDENGKGSISGLNAAKYWVKETKAPSGYSLNQTPQAIDATNATNGQTYEIEISDVPLLDPVGILLQKIDATTNKAGAMQGAQFEVKYYTSIMDSDPAAAGQTPARTWVFETDSDGYLTYDEDYLVSGDELYVNANGTPSLPYGTLTFKEIKAPEGYLINSTIITAKIDASSSGLDISYQAPTQKEQPLTLRLTKTEAGSGKAVEGVVFTHTDPDGKQKTYTTDANGKITISNLAYGNHTLVETKTVAGLTLNTQKIQFTVGTDNKITITSGSAEETSTNGKVTVNVANDGCIDVAMENKLANFDILVHKVNENSTKLEGAEFTLYSDSNCKTQIGKATSNSDGELRFSDLTIGAVYYMKETAAPEGYKIPVNSDGSEIVYKIQTASSAVDGTFTLYVNDKAYTSDSGQFHVAGTASDRVADLTIVNQTSVQLPETGSNGMIIIAGVGAVLACVAIVLIVRRKKK